VAERFFLASSVLAVAISFRKWFNQETDLLLTLVRKIAANWNAARKPKE